MPANGKWTPNSAQLGHPFLSHVHLKTEAGAFLKVISVNYQLGIFLCYIGKCHIKQNPSSLSSGCSVACRQNMHTAAPNTEPCSYFCMLKMVWQDAHTLISGLQKWAVSQVRLGSLLTAVMTGTLYFMVICIYQFVVFCTVKKPERFADQDFPARPGTCPVQ